MKCFKLLLSGLLICLLFPNQLLAEDDLLQCSDSVIVITPFMGDNNEGYGPRSPALVPISASYEAMLSTLFLAFTYNLGEIEVTTSSCSPSRQVNGTRANSTSSCFITFYTFC